MDYARLGDEEIMDMILEGRTEALEALYGARPARRRSDDRRAAEDGAYEGLEITVEPNGSERKAGPVYLQTRL